MRRHRQQAASRGGRCPRCAGHQLVSPASPTSSPQGRRARSGVSSLTPTKSLALPAMRASSDDDHITSATVRRRRLPGCCACRAGHLQHRAPTSSPQGRRAQSGVSSPTPTKSTALPVMRASSDEDDDSDGAAPSSAGVLCPPRGSPTAPIGSPPDHRAPSGAARRCRARAVVPAAHVPGLQRAIQGLRDLAGAIDPFVVDQTACERLVDQLEGAV